MHSKLARCGNGFVIGLVSRILCTSNDFSRSNCSTSIYCKETTHLRSLKRLCSLKHYVQ
uniref:Uncharacterized protein n=1 Tax=Octopus bimaculoides TaxID=37653 RepID=A0A0L8GRJ5_OCTBM